MSGDRAAQLVRDCRTNGTHFVCHKGSLAGVNMHCRGVHEIAPSRAYQFGQAIGVQVVELDPDTLTPPGE